MLDDVGLSNGIGFSPEHETLYYTDSWTDRIDAFDYEAETGDLTNRRTFVDLSETAGMPDGLTVDADGYVWSAQYEGGHIARFTPDGEFDRRIKIPVSQVTSVMFGGADLGDLYVTTAGGTDPDAEEYAGAVFRLDPGVRGREEFRSQIKL
jgi:sugar lactone lactonase YvrE